MHIIHPLQSQRLDRRAFVGLGGAGAASLVLAGCGSADSVADRSVESRQDEAAQDYESMFSSYEVADEPNGDPDAVVWPDFVLSSPPEVQELYAFHVTSGDLMRYIPCFCGCTGSGHRNNRDCYVKAVHADGSITFDPMAPT